MGYLDAFTANTFREDSQGRLVLVISRRRRKAYLVPPERAAAGAWRTGLAVVGTHRLFHIRRHPLRRQLAAREPG